MGLVVPAVLPVSRAELERRLSFFADIPSITRVQIDVVDGHLASPASWPYNAGDWKLETGDWKKMRSEGYTLPKLEQLEYEIDLMCLDAAEAAGDWLAAGASRLTFHIETAVATPNLLSTIRYRYGGGDDFALAHLLVLGLALNVETDLRTAEPCLLGADYVQFMGIAKIGTQGQPFDARVLDQIRTFRARHPNIPMQVDGGVSLENARHLFALEVSSIIVGSAILEAKDPTAAVRAFQALESPYGV